MEKQKNLSGTLCDAANALRASKRVIPHAHNRTFNLKLLHFTSWLNRIFEEQIAVRGIKAAI